MKSVRRSIDAARLGVQTPVLPRELLRADAPGGDQSQFGDSSWDLGPLDYRENRRAIRILWDAWPADLLESGKRIVWLWLNVDTPAAVFERPGNTSRARWRPSTTYTRHLALRRFFHWLAERGVRRLADLSTDDLRDYGIHVSGLNLAHDGKRDALFVVTLAWAYAPYLPPHDRLVMPPWDDGEDFSGPVVSSGENRTVPVHPATMSPLLTWAIRFVDELAPDILAARDWARSINANRATTAVPGGHERVLKYLQRLRERGAGLPTYSLTRLSGRPAIGYIAGTLGVGANQVARNVQRSGLALAEPPSAPAALSGAVGGRDWRYRIPFDQADLLATHLLTACLIVTGYLTGMRPEELLHLERGSCTERETPSGSVRYEVNGRHFKGVTDDRGITIPGGEVRPDPWVAVAPVARAIRVAEQIFDARALWPAPPASEQRSAGYGGALTAENANHRIASFIEWVNQLVSEHGIHGAAIPDDPAGAVVLRRFRRTLAWFIYRLPGGKVALGVQYGHLQALTSEGYGGRSRAGLHQVMALEEARTIADNLTSAAERLRRGESVSGPAASRFVRGVTEFADRFEGKFLSDRQYRALLSNPNLRIFDHPQAALACVFDKTKALCVVSRGVTNPDATPVLGRCQRGCANIARTDQHIAELKLQINDLREDIASGLNPRPIELRLSQRVDALEDVVRQHEGSSQ